MADKALTSNDVTLTVSDATAPIQEAGLKLYNFQQAADGDLNSVVDGQNITVNILSIKIGGVEKLA